MQLCLNTAAAFVLSLTVSHVVQGRMHAMTNMVSDTLEALSQQSKVVAEDPAGMQARVAAGQNLTEAGISS